MTHQPELRRSARFAVLAIAAAGVAAAGSTAATAATPTAHNPNGRAAVKTAGRTAEFTGWAVDRNAATRRVRIVRLVDGYRVGTRRTWLPKAAVTRKYHASTTPGFDLRTTVRNDGLAHTACVAARNIGGGVSKLLNCVTLPAQDAPALASHDPFGWTRKIRHGTTVTFRGRATDPDFRGRPETVVLYVDGVPAGTVTTHRVTASSAEGVGANSAYSVTSSVDGNRTHIGCVWAVDVGPGSNSLLGCKRFDIKSHATDPQTAAEAKMGRAVVKLARKQFSKPYVWGAEGPKAFDCSGLVQWTYKRNGYLTPRVAADQYAAAHLIRASQARPGDLVFYYNREGYVHHVGIYVRPGMTIAAMSPDLGIGWQPIAQTPSWDGSFVSYGSFTHN